MHCCTQTHTNTIYFVVLMMMFSVCVGWITVRSLAHKSHTIQTVAKSLISWLLLYHHNCDIDHCHCPPPSTKKQHSKGAKARQWMLRRWSWWISSNASCKRIYGSVFSILKYICLWNIFEWVVGVCVWLNVFKYMLGWVWLGMMGDGVLASKRSLYTSRWSTNRRWAITCCQSEIWFLLIHHKNGIYNWLQEQNHFLCMKRSSAGECVLRGVCVCGWVYGCIMCLWKGILVD